MNKQTVSEFFDRLAPEWDASAIKNQQIVDIILDNAGAQAGKSVLDVACGTGILFADYKNRNVSSITAVDISPEMIKIAASKPIAQDIELITADACELTTHKKFDVIMVYNAFPHFCEPELLIKKLASLLNEGGTLSIAHGMSKQAIDAHHSGDAREVSNGLMEATELSELMQKYLTVTVCLSDENMYQVCGKRLNL